MGRYGAKYATCKIQSHQGQNDAQSFKKGSIFKSQPILSPCHLRQQLLGEETLGWVEETPG